MKKLQWQLVKFDSCQSRVIGFIIKGHIDTDFSRDIVIDTASVMGMAINSSITPTATLELVKHDKQHNSSSQQVDQFPGHIELQ